jgi:hypothetical protein
MKLVLLADRAMIDFLQELLTDLPSFQESGTEKISKFSFQLP